MDEEFLQGLQDIDGFSHILVLSYLHQSKSYSLLVQPPIATGKKGIFATQAPSRPNPIGLSCFRLLKRVRNVLSVEDIDLMDGTPILDIKPYIPIVDPDQKISIGWLEGRLSEFSS